MAASSAARSDDREAALTAFASDRIDPTGTSMTEERRLVTALFADLSGFTPLSERLDAEELLEVIDPIITALSDIVGRFGGYVEKFAGDALLALFGAPIAHEDDATRALEVSIEMHRELARLRGTLGENGEGLTLHIGIASGRGIARMIGSHVRMDYAVLGDSVILAQRLESATPSGQTYISQATREIVQDRFDLDPVPPLTLKGKAEPVPAWRLLGARRAADQRSGLAGRRHAPLLGRAREVARLSGALERLASGGGTEIVGIVGEPGVGKSRLVDEARRIAAEQEITWLDARCLSYGAALPYWPIADLLRRELGLADEPAASDADALAGLEDLDVPNSSSYIATLLGLAPPVELAEVEPEAVRRGLHDAVRAWLHARATSGGVILAMEDVHWADASTLGLLAHLAARDGEGSLGIWGTSRPPAPSWLAEAVTDAAPATIVDVGQLDAAAIGELVDYVIGGAAAPELGAVIADRSAGNPFFAEELVRSLSESGSLVEDREGHWRLRETEDAGEVPATIEGVLSARVDALGPSTQSTLAVASVIGRRVDLRLLERVTGNPGGLGQDLGTLVDAGLLDPIDSGGDFVQFHHALIADVAYGRLLRRRRRELHGRTAEAAEALYGAGDESIDFLARHLYLAEAGPRAIAYLERAAARAGRLYANDEAIIHLRRAEKLAAKDPSQADVLLRVRLTLGDLQEVVGAYDDAEATYRRVLEGPPLVRAWRGLASVHRVRGRYADAMRILDEAFADDRLMGQDLRPLWLERGWALTSTEAMREAIAALQQGIATDPDGVDPVAGELLIELARAESYAGRLEHALEHAAKALAIARGNGDLRAETTALRVLGLVEHDLGHLDQAAASLRRDLELGRRIGSVEAIGGALINLGLVERDRGEMDAAIACDREAIATFERVNHGAGRAIGYANLADKLRRLGDLAEAETYAHRAQDLAEEIGHAMTRADAVQILGEISLARGAHEEAVTLAEQSAELFLAADARPGAAEAYELAERAWRAAGDEERAAASAARVQELSG
jgi:class 3 adenylate cyclase/tetratricopeptide (TPR) repeat protein